MSWVHRCMIIPADQVELARNLCATLAGDGGSGMFTTALSATGQDPATHYISSGLIESEFADLLPLLTCGDNGEVLDVSSYDPMAFEALCKLNGITPPPDKTVSALMAVVDVSNQDAFTAMARLGLQIVQLPLDQTK